MSVGTNVLPIDYIDLFPKVRFSCLESLYYLKKTEKCRKKLFLQISPKCMLHTLAGYFSTTKAQKMCKSPKYPSIINHKKPFYVNVNGEKDEKVSLQRTKPPKKVVTDRSYKLSCFSKNLALGNITPKCWQVAPSICQ